MDNTIDFKCLQIPIRENTKGCTYVIICVEKGYNICRDLGTGAVFAKKIDD